MHIVLGVVDEAVLAGLYDFNKMQTFMLSQSPQLHSVSTKAVLSHIMTIVPPCGAR